MVAHGLLLAVLAGSASTSSAGAITLPTNSLHIEGLGTKSRDTGGTSRTSAVPDASGPLLVPGGDGASIEGGISQTTVDSIVKKRVSQLQYCFERELPANPSLAGTVVIHFTFDAAGKTTARLKTSTVHNTRVESCVVERFMAIRFEGADGGGSGDFPLVFKAK